MPSGYIRVTVPTANKHCINVMHQVTSNAPSGRPIFISMTLVTEYSVSPLDLTVEQHCFRGSRSLLIRFGLFASVVLDLKQVRLF